MRQLFSSQLRLPAKLLQPPAQRFSARSSANALCHNGLQTRIAGQIDQHSRSVSKSSSRYSLVHILLTWSAKTAPNMPAFNDFSLKSNSRYSLVRILPASSSESAPKVTVFSTFWSANRSPAAILRAFCRQLSQIEASNCGNRDPATPKATLPEKTALCAQECFHPWIHTLPNCYSPLLLHARTALANYVVHMMTGLPWTIVRNWEVFEPNVLW